MEFRLQAESFAIAAFRLKAELHALLIYICSVPLWQF